jgi:regulator of replication initiation timing
MAERYDSRQVRKERDEALRVKAEEIAELRTDITDLVLGAEALMRENKTLKEQTAAECTEDASSTDEARVTELERLVGEVQTTSNCFTHGSVPRCPRFYA